jgi:hypothetical protein
MDHYTLELAVVVDYKLEEVEVASIELEAVAPGMAVVMEVEEVLHMREVVEMSLAEVVNDKKVAAEVN